jgi:hypothetical protein
MPPPRLRVWLRQLLTHDRAEPDCIGPEERPAHVRLLDLCDLRGPELSADHRVTQEQLREEGWRLCGCYDPSKDGGHLGLELLRFAKLTDCANAVRSFGRLLAARAFDANEPDQLNLWVEAHWVVAELVREWHHIEGWVVRDAAGSADFTSTENVPLDVRVSAVGVWARFGPASRFAELVRALQYAVASAYSANDEASTDTLARHTVALYRRTVDERESPRFSALLSGEISTGTSTGWQPFAFLVGSLLIGSSQAFNFQETTRILQALGLSSLGHDENATARTG